ncbi:MAG: biotin/lipoyl-binding protein, partial [Cyclobacteriaceae bacterium]|nr:biotin/lipoyl-binding protein [Cyclobacteriaceae bacterium]
MKSEVSNRTFGQLNSNFSPKYLLVLAFLAGITLSSCSSGNGKNANKEKLVNIPVLELQSRGIEVPKTYVCDIQAVQFVEVRAKVEGFVDRIYVDEGQFVKKGQTLFQLTSNEFNEMVNSANAKMMQARAEAKAASLEVERLQVLVNKNIISSSELELAKSKRAVAESSILEAESILKNAKTGL